MKCRNTEDLKFPGQPLTPSDVARVCVHEPRDIRYAKRELLTERFGCAWFKDCVCAFCVRRRDSN